MQPSRQHRFSIVNSMARDATQVVRKADNPPDTLTIRSWINVVEDMFRWSLFGIQDKDTNAGFFRDEFLESHFASHLASKFPEPEQRINQSLINIHSEVTRQIMVQSGHSPEILVRPEVNLTSDNLASLVAEEKISASSIVSDYRSFAMMLATCEEHDELFQRLDVTRLNAIDKIVDVLAEQEPNEPVSMELTCNPYFKGASERLYRFVERRFERKEDRLDLFLAGATYLKAFERCVCDILAACALQRLSKEPEPAISLSESRWTNDEVLTSMSAGVQAPIYVLGSFDQRITIYNEQVRALRLSRALIEESVATQGRDICVIGGGVAGITTAIALATKGCNVTLFEKHTEVLAVQENSFHRFVHPHAFSWPITGSVRQDAGLPILDWSADSADKVIVEMRRGVKFNEEKMNNLAIKRNAEVKQINDSDGTVSVKFELKNTNKIRQLNFDAAIVAIGFGDDSFSTGSFATESYWTPDNLESFSEGAILVSGTGDGGLIDAIRACTKSFDHRELIDSFSRSSDLISIGEQIASIDEQARQAKKRGKNLLAWDEYDEIDIPEKLVSKFRERSKQNLVVYLNHKNADVLSPNAAIFNKAITLCFIKAGGIDLVQGELANVVIDDSSLEVVITHDGETQTLSLQAVVVRHGPKVVPYFKKFIGETLWTHCASIAGAITNLRITEQLDHETDKFFSAHKY